MSAARRTVEGQRVSGTTGAAGATPLKALCTRLRIPTLVVNDVNGPEVDAALERANPDLIVTFHFDQILSGTTLGRAGLGGLNIHPGLLPRHRGPVPTIHALAEDEPAFGVTVHRLAVTIDAGATLAQEAVPLPAGTTASRASVLLHERGRVLLDELLARIAATGIPEGEVPALLPYCPFPDRALLAGLKRRGRKLTDAADLREALTLNARA